VSPRPIKAPAVMIAPHSARIAISPQLRRTWLCLLAQHPQAAAHHQEDAGKDDETATTAAARPGTICPLRVEIVARAKQSPRPYAHQNPPRVLDDVPPNTPAGCCLHGAGARDIANLVPSVLFRQQTAINAHLRSPGARERPRVKQSAACSDVARRVGRSR
jgi:hypothetical protein